MNLADGLYNSRVYTITQDQKGFMWFGTEDGLHKYDGYKFTVYRYDPFDSTSITNNVITCLKVDHKGNLWVGTQRGLNRYEVSQDKFIRYLHNSKDSTSLIENHIQTIYEDHQQRLWINTFTGIHLLSNLKTGNFQRIYLNEKDAPIFKAMVEDANGRFWIGSEKGLWYFEAGDDKISQYQFSSPDYRFFANLNIKDLLVDHQNRLWISTFRKGLFVLDPRRNIPVQFIPDPNHPKSIQDSRLKRLFLDHGNYLWLGSEQGGVFKLNLTDLNIDKPELISFEQYQNTDYKYSLSYRTVEVIYEDFDGNLWLGTDSGGINFVDMRGDKFSKYEYIPYSNSGLSHSKAWGLCEDLEGNIWIGTDGGGLDKLNPNTGIISHYQYDKNDPYSIGDSAILTAMCDHKGGLWFGTYAGGLSYYDAPNDRFIRYTAQPEKPNSLKKNSIYALLEDHQYQIWIGSLNDGLYLFDRVTQHFTNFNTENSGLVDNNVRTFYEDHQHMLWVGTEGGLSKFDPLKNTFTTVGQAPGKPQLSHQTIRAMIGDADPKILWIGTGGGGLNKLNTLTGDIRVYTETDGLANDNIRAILKDKYGNLWISTNNGISRFDPQTEKFQNYTSEDGIQEGEFLIGSGLLTQNGLMYFGGIGGLNVFHPDSIKTDSVVPRTVFTDFRLFNQKVPIGEKDSPLQKHISETESIILTYQQAVFTLEFVAMSYANPDFVEYAFMMEGIDTSWNYVGKQRTATYTTLKDGEYIFKVKAANHDGVWSQEPSSIHIKVLPPWWKSNGAYAIYFLLGILAVYLWRAYTLGRIRLKNRLKLERLEKEKSEELHQVKQRFFINISHEFRTPITLMLGSIERILNGTNGDFRFHKQLQIAHRNARRLLDLVNQLMDFQMQEAGQLHLKVREQDLLPFIKKIMMDFRPLAEQKNIAFEFKCEYERFVLWYDSTKLEKIFINLIANAFKYTPREGFITIQLEISNEGKKELEIIIRNSGKGISKEHLPHIFERFYQVDAHDYASSGIGLALTKELIQLHHGRITVNSIENEQTSFQIYLPLSPTQFHPDEYDVENPQEHTQRGIVESSSFEIKNNTPSSKLTLPPNAARVLIIEDDEDMREYIREILITRFRIIEAKNGYEGYQKALSEQPDLILSDIMMPEMDGIELCKKLKENKETQHIPTLLLTARSSKYYQLKSLEIGADDYVTKPFDPQVLLFQINNRLKIQKSFKQKLKSDWEVVPASNIIHSPEQEWLRKAKEIIYTNLSDPSFDVDKLAAQMKVSRSYVYRKFPILVGENPSEFIRNQRLKTAADLMKQEKWKVSDISYKVGFQNPRYFSKCFRESFGVSPSEFMRREE